MTPLYEAKIKSSAAALAVAAVALITIMTIAGIAGLLRARVASASPWAGTRSGGARADDCSFTVVPSANADLYNVLNSVTALAPSNTWAVGYYEGADNVQHTLTEHWNGSQWVIVASPDEGSGPPNGALFSVDVLSPTDIWAVGYYYDLGERTLVLHWDGAVWSIVPSPNQGTHDSNLYAVTAISANDVWAVGTYYDGTYDQTLVEHWNGTAWSIVPSPNLPTVSNTLYAVNALSANDIWSVGASTHGFNVGQTLVEHWDGTAWSIVPSPNQGAFSNELASVVAVAADDVWAVGRYVVNSVYHTLTEHWDGTAWSIVPSPNVGSDYNVLSSVAEGGANDIWAVGAYTDSNNRTRTLMEHWDGSAWSIVPSSTPDPGSVYNEHYGVAAAGPGDVWAVGMFTDTTLGMVTLAEHWNGTAWSVVQTPNAAMLNNELNGVAAVAVNDVWAAGDATNPISGTAQPLIERWDGSTWNIVESPNPGGMAGHLKGVTALSANDVWAVGDAGGGHQSLTEHWGGSEWNVVPSPNAGATYNIFRAVAALSTNDVWAVGDYQNNAPSSTLIAHWNGTSWSLVPSPNPVGAAFLSGVTMTATDDAWAVGYYNTSGIDRAFAEHWDGATWSIVPIVHPGSGADTLFGISAESANDVWAAGFYDNSSNISRTLLEHWNGTAWSIVPSPNVGSDHNILRSVLALAADDAWAVGDYIDGTSGPSLAEHWDGTAWSLVPSASVGTEFSLLNAVSAAGAGSLWAVGYYNGLQNPTQTLTEHYICTTPTATPTGSPVTSRTPTPPGTPTACPLHFTDVPVGSTFYAYVRCLACRGIINGYPDGTFKPNNNVTRGQLSKIVSNSAGFSDPQTVQMFQDVPVGSTFFQYIGRLAVRRYIGGYPCGGQGEPCVPPANLPYFRPGNQAIRGQISKIVSNSAGFADPPAGQTFQDVPAASTFYTYTERLASRGVMSGYPCGGASEPCIPPANRPYFRPNNNATRGQTSKIVANTFFPNCSTPVRSEK